MKLQQALNEVDIPDIDMPRFTEEDVLQAFMDDDPYVELKNIIPRDFLPKVIRWIERKVKNVKVPDDAENLQGGVFGAKIDGYLQKELGDMHYEENARAMARELMAAYQEWSGYENKPKDLPDVRMPG